MTTLTQARVLELMSEHSDGYGKIEDWNAFSRAVEQAAPRPQLMSLDKDAELRFILGRPNFMCGPYAKLLRFRGQAIAYRAEDEQAAVIHFFLQLYLEHGAAWRQKADDFITETQAIINTAISDEG